jgi:[ribosomal protein S5]-alanine N-acetyltransferase
MLLTRLPGEIIHASPPDRRFAASEWRFGPRTRNDGDVSYARGWPATLTEPSLLRWPVTLRPLAVRDAKPWREARVRNADWLRPWEPTNPETPLYQTSLGPYIAMVRTMRREARHGITLPWVVLVDGHFAGQVTVGNIVWGSARTASVGYWIDEQFAGHGVIPTSLAMALDHCFMVVGLHRIEATIRPENRASRRVVEKLGFHEEGIRRRSLHVDGAWRDHVCYAITAEDAASGLLPRWRSTFRAARSRIG